MGDPHERGKVRTREEERACPGPPPSARHLPWQSRTWLQRPFVSGNESSSLGHDNRCFVRGAGWGVSRHEGLPPGPADVGREMIYCCSVLSAFGYLPRPQHRWRRRRRARGRGARVVQARGPDTLLGGRWWGPRPRAGSIPGAAGRREKSPQLLPSGTCENSRKSG